MKVFLTIWISAVLVQEVIPGTLVRLPRHTPKHPALVETEYEAKYEQTGRNGNENSGLFSGKQEIVHDNCADNWNVFADKCAALIKDLVASLAGTVSSRPGDATKLQLQIKNTFKHFDNTHNCTCLNDTGKSIPTLDLSCLFNNVTINTIAPTANNNRNSAGANNEHKSGCCKDGQSSNGNNGSDLGEGLEGLGSNGDGDDGNGSSDNRDNNSVTLYSPPAVVPRKQNTALDHAKNAGFSPENDGDSETGSNSRRQAEYPQVSWQPGNKTRHSQINNGRSNNISRSPYPFLVTPQPNTAYGSPTLATYSDGNNLPNGGSGFGSDGQRNSNPSPAGASGESGIPLRIQTLPASNTYKSVPASDSHYKAAALVPPIGSHNSAPPTVTGVPPVFNNHQDAAVVPEIPAPGGHNSKNGYSLSKAPVTDDSYDSKPVPVQLVTDVRSDSQPGTTPLIEPTGPKFPKNNSPNSGSYSNKPQFVLSTSTNDTPGNPHSSDSHALPKNQNNKPGAEIIQPVSSLTQLDSVSGTPNTKPVLTIVTPEILSTEKDKRVDVPVINSDSNIPESRGPESQWGATNPLPTGRNPNPSSADVNTGSSAIPEVLSASLKGESEHTTSASTTNKFSDTITPPLDHIPPLVYVKPALPEADSHKSENPLNAGHTLNNPSDLTAVPVTLTPSSLSQTFDAAGRSGSDNVYSKPHSGAPVSVYPVYVPTTMRPLSYNIDVKPKENSGSNGNDNSGKSNTGEVDHKEHHAEDAEPGIATVLQTPGQSLQDTGRPQSNTEAGDSSVQNGIGQSPVLGSVSNTNPDNEYDEDCDENTDPDGDDRDAKTPAVVLPEQSVSIVSDPVVQGNAPAPDEGEDCDENAETANGATTLVGVSPVQPVPTVSEPVVQVVQGNVPVVGENTGSNNDPNTISDSGSNTGIANGATTLVGVSPVQPVPTVSEPVVQVAQEKVPDSNFVGENTGSSNDPSIVSDSGSNTGIANGATTLVGVTPVQPVPKVSEPVVQVVQGNVPVVGENTGSNNDPNTVSDSGSNTGIANGATTLVGVSPVQPVPKVSDPAAEVVQENVPDSDDGEDCDENEEHSSDATALVGVPPVQPVSTVSEPVVQVVQEKVPDSNVVGENTGSSNDPNTVSDSVSNRGTASGATTLVGVSPVQPVSTVSEPVVQVVQGNVPVIGENTGSNNYPNIVSDSGSNTGTANGATTLVAVSPAQSLSKVSEPAGQSLQSGGSPQSNTGSGVDAVQNGNSQLTAINVTPLPHTYLADGSTPISISSEVQPDNLGNEDSVLYKPTTFQTPATDTTSPKSILIPTESTGRLTHGSTASQSSVRHSTSPLSKESDDDDEDEDCCSCESCSEDEITDPKQYKETACKNLEEARRELKAIFDKIKKKLKCGRKAMSTIATR